MKCIFSNFSSPVCIWRPDYTTQLIAEEIVIDSSSKHLNLSALKKRSNYLHKWLQILITKKLLWTMYLWIFTGAQHFTTHEDFGWSTPCWYFHYYFAEFAHTKKVNSKHHTSVAQVHTLDVLQFMYIHAHPHKPCSPSVQFAEEVSTSTHILYRLQTMLVSIGILASYQSPTQLSVT